MTQEGVTHGKQNREEIAFVADCGTEPDGLSRVLSTVSYIILALYILSLQLAASV